MIILDSEVQLATYRLPLINHKKSTCHLPLDVKRHLDQQAFLKGSFGQMFRLSEPLSVTRKSSHEVA
jgi:hypothetical protein